MSRFVWGLAHKFAIGAPLVVGGTYGATLGIAAQAKEGGDVRALFDNQIEMWRAMSHAPYGPLWLVGLLVVWLLAVLWTGMKESAASEASVYRPAARQERKQPVAPHSARSGKVTPSSGGVRSRDTSISKALGFAITGDWDASIGYGIVLSGRSDALARTVEKFRAHAAVGELRVWGRRTEGLFEAIPQSFWERNTLSVDALLSFLPAGRTEPMDGHTPVLRFHDIMVNRVEIERVWPHAV